MKGKFFTQVINQVPAVEKGLMFVVSYQLAQHLKKLFNTLTISGCTAIVCPYPKMFRGKKSSEMASEGMTTCLGGSPASHPVTPPRGSEQKMAGSF